MGKKIDLSKEFKEYYTSKRSPQIVEFGEIGYLSIEGKGKPAGEEYMKKMEALYPLAFAVKNLSKGDGRDFVVPKLEGLWWVESDKPALEVPRDEWRWRLLIRLPDFVTPKMVEEAKKLVLEKKGIELVKEIRFEKMMEGKCVQILHVGPYATEEETIEKMRVFMEENNLVENGLHHEIYLSDPRRVAPEKLRTILRQPVKEK